MIELFVETLLKFFFLTTPFFALSMFLAMTSDLTEEKRASLANRVVVAAWIVTMVMFFCGQFIFKVFGISVEAFRIGAGALLFLSAVSLMNPKVSCGTGRKDDDIAVVPLAVPVIIGPATCGPLLVLWADLGNWSSRGVAIVSMSVALLVLWGILRMASWVEKHVGQRGLAILMRLTGLILAALSAQMVMTGVCSFTTTMIQ